MPIGACERPVAGTVIRFRNSDRLREWSLVMVGGDLRPRCQAWHPFEPQVNTIAGDLAETKSLIELKGRVECFHVNCHAPAQAFSFGQNFLQQQRANASTSVRRQESDIHNATFMLPVMNI